MKLGPRTRKRGQIDKILTRKRETVARMRAGPPLPARSSPRGGAFDLLGPRGTDTSTTSLVTTSPFEPGGFRAVVVVACDPGLGGEGYERLFALRTDLSSLRADARIVALDFVIHPVQLERAAASGADAIVLVARLVDDPRLWSLRDRAQELRLDVVVEVSSNEELERALSQGVDVIAVSLRDRDHGRVDETVARSLIEAAHTRARTMLLSAPSDFAGDVGKVDLIVFDPPVGPSEGTSALVPGTEPA